MWNYKVLLTILINLIEALKLLIHRAETDFLINIPKTYSTT